MAEVVEFDLIAVACDQTTGVEYPAGERRVSVLCRARLARASMDGMNGKSSSAGKRPPPSWLPPVIAIAVTGGCGPVALAGLASAALTAFGPYPRMGWLTAGLYAQAALGVTAVTLLIASLRMARGRRVIARLSWAVAALSVACLIAATLLGRPA